MTRSRKYECEPVVHSPIPDRGTPVVYVYLHAGRAVYIGSSRDLPRRMKEHRQQDWWPYATDLFVFQYATMDDALVWEIQWIHEHQPAFNKTHVGGRCTNSCSYPYWGSGDDELRYYEELFRTCVA